MVEGAQHAAVGGLHADEQRHAEHDAGGGEHRAQQVLADVGPGDEAEEDHRRHVPGDARVAQGDGARAAFGDTVIVGDDEDGGAEALVEVADEREDLGAGVRVEVAGGLVGEQDGRGEGEGAGDGDALALAAGEFVGEVIEAVAELHEVEQFARAVVDLLRGRAPCRCRGRATFSRQESEGRRLKNWKMKPILSRRRRVRSSSERSATDWPSMRISPEVGRSRPPMRLRRVDLPEPEGPTMETISPRAMCRSMDSSAATWRLPL